MRFKNREQAGKLLATKLDEYKNSDCVIYALPRGGVVLGVEIAKYLLAPLDLVITRKIGHPSWSEYAICAVSENETTICNQEETRNVDPNWLEQAISRERLEAKRRRKVYLANRPPINSTGKIAIITDDGIATGLTIFAAIKEIRKHDPAKIVVAVPVMPPDIYKQLEQVADQIITFESDTYLGAVGAYYDEFEQVTDEQVIALIDTVR